MRKWLVTGGLGFIGSAFIRIALDERLDTEIINLDAMTYAGNPENLRTVERNPRYNFIRGTICDDDAVRRAIGAGVDAVVNFAAETHVDRSILDPKTFLETDILGTHVLLQAVRQFGVPRYVQVSTDEVYGDVQVGFSTESDRLAPRSPYSASKAGGDLQVLAYCNTYGTPAMITRGSNTYGPYQYPEKLIPLFITNLLDDEAVPVYGDGMQIRDWLYVDDHARGILHVLENGEPGETYNISGGVHKTNLDVTRRLVDLCGRSFQSHVRHVQDRPGHDRRYAADGQKLRNLGWKPAMEFETGLMRTVQWYRDNQSWWRPLKSGDFAEFYKRQYAHR